jgi:hypothetical protein
MTTEHTTTRLRLRGRYEDLPPVDSDREVEYQDTPQEPSNPSAAATTDTVDINQIVDDLAGVDPVPPQSINDETFEPEDLSQIPIQREPYPKRTWKPSRKARENQLYESELPALNTMTTDTIENKNQPIENNNQPIGKAVDPKNMLEAMRSPDWPKWVTALSNECSALEDNNTWVVVSSEEVPPGHDVISCKWVFRIKSDGTYKCRWVARGSEQVEGLGLPGDVRSRCQSRLLQAYHSSSGLLQLDH